LIAHIEVTVDYPEHDIEEITGQRVYNEIRGIRKRLADIIKDFDRGRIIREGINVVIVGRPNVGKSSLLNQLAGKNRAIVTDIPGTTRDIIEEYINVKGIPVRITDTAGIRETEDRVEKIGVERAEKAVEQADLVIMMVDASTGLQEEDIRVLIKIRKKKHIIIINKTDIADTRDIESIKDELDDENTILASVKNGTGLSLLEDMIEGLFVEGTIGSGDGVLITNIRHKDLIDKAIISIDEACRSYEGGMPLDCLTIDIKDAAEYLGQITGETVSDDVMESIFSRFCIGK
jgi:tRNA modification GTPase